MTTVSLKVHVSFDILKSTLKALGEVEKLFDHDNDINKQFFITYAAAYTAKFRPMPANLLAALFIGYIDKLRRKNKMLAMDLLKGLQEHYSKGPISNLHILRLFGVELNKKAKLLPETSQKLTNIVSALKAVIKSVTDDEQNISLFTMEGEKVLFAGIKHLIEDGISNLQQEKEQSKEQSIEQSKEQSKGQSKETKKYKEEAKSHINNAATLTEELINKELELFCELFNCRIILFTARDKIITQQVFNPPLVFYRVCSVHVFYFFDEETLKEKKSEAIGKADITAFSALLYKQELLGPYYKELYKEKDRSPTRAKETEDSPPAKGKKAEDPSPKKSKRLDLPDLEPRDMTILRKSTKFAAEVYNFFNGLIKKEAKYENIEEILKMMEESKKIMLNSEIEELKENFKAIEDCQEILQNRDLVQKTILARELVTSKRGDCSKCGNKDVKIIEGTAACADELSHCLCCMKQGNTYECPKCKEKLKEDVISLMTQENCTLCRQKNIILPCGDSADVGCLKEQMVKAKKDMKGFSKIMCEKHKKEVGYEILKQVDSELSAILSLNEFIICPND